MGPIQSIQAVQYELVVCESMMDLVHGHSETIQEIFVPSSKVIFNSKGFIFHAEKPRNIQCISLREPEIEHPLKDIQLPLSLVERIVAIANLKLEVKAKENELKPDLSRVWGKDNP